LDLNRVVGDLGDFVFKQTAHEIRVASAEDDFHPLPALADFHDHGLDRLADVMRLAGNLFAARQDRFGAIDADDGRARIEPLNDAADQFAFLAVVALEDAVALSLADLLNHYLLGRLGRDPPKRFRVDWLPGPGG